MLSNIRFVLVETSHPGNVGAAARAMKNMGLGDLVLVRPCGFPSAEATARASSADDLLHRARVVDTLSEAVTDCGLVVATSARPRHLPWETQEPRECAREVVAVAMTAPAAIVFGPERIGLSNADLAFCHRLVTIPADPAYPSLNLGMAVQILAYEVQLAARSPAKRNVRSGDFGPATTEDMERLYAHLERVMMLVQFEPHARGGHLMARIRRLFNRATLDRNEYNILRGLLSAVESRCTAASGARRAQG